MPAARFLPIIIVLSTATLSGPAWADNPDNGGAGGRAEDAAVESGRRHEYDINQQERSVIPGHPGGLHAANRAQDLRAYFLADGVDLVRRTEAEPAWRFHLSMRDAMMAGGRHRVEWASPTAEGRTVSYDRGAIQERYENTEQGIRIGLTLPGVDEGQESEVTFNLDTELTMQRSFDRRELGFYENGVRRLRLQLTSAVDELGHDVSAELAIQGKTLK